MTMTVRLDDKYTATDGRVFMSGTQALVRLPMVQMRRDTAAGLNTGAFISGYRGSPIGGYDQQLVRAQKFLAEHDIKFQPGVNEELAATSVWGSQQLALSPGARKDGLVGIWYGKGPGVDRCGDVFKHANAAGSSEHGGVLCIAGDDHACKSSTIPHQSDHAFAAALMPMVYPSSVHEFVELGLFAIAMSRYSGCWTGMKVIADTVETSASVDLGNEAVSFVIPDDFDMPDGGLNWRWPDAPMAQDERLQAHKGYAALAFARANGIDMHTFRAATPRYGIIASGKAYEDTMQALTELELDRDALSRLGISIFKVRMPWPLEPTGVQYFSEGLEEVLVVEDRREVIENQIKQQLFNWRADVRPRIVGKFDEAGQAFLPSSEQMSALTVARALAERLTKLGIDDDLNAHLQSRLAVLDARARASNDHAPPVLRTPYFCSGCPHNTSTRVPEGSRAMAGIGCHFMALWMDRKTEGFTQMGGEGTPWISQAHFTDEPHQFANIGDGTYFHSGLLAIRASIAAKVNITYKVLYNDAVAMTGGQPMDGDLSPERVTRQLHAEGVTPIYLLSDTPEVYRKNLAPGTIVKHRDELDTVMLEIRDKPGCSGIVYVQTCAAEKRRRRKRGTLEDPLKRVFIHPEICEGCGDCSVQSNCVSVEPLETPLGRKRQINQSTCNKDFSCVKGFCPSFITIEGADLRKPDAQNADLRDVPDPVIREFGGKPVNIAVTGVGGTGVLTIGAILGMAAHIDGKASMILDMAGLAQKGGAVLSHVRLAERPDQVSAPRIAAGRAHVLLAADDVVAAGIEGMGLSNIETTTGIVNTAVMPVADFVRNRDFDFQAHAVEATIRNGTREDSAFVNFSELARRVIGDSIATNIMMVGYACQKGLFPLSLASFEAAIRLNGVAVDANLNAFGWGRIFAANPDEVSRVMMGGDPVDTPLSDMSLAEIIDDREARLVAYQGRRLAKKFRKLLDTVATKTEDDITRAVAISYSKLLMIKDEYEVARLLSSGSFLDDLQGRFDGDTKISFNLAPPFLPGTDPAGRPKKRQFSARMMPVFRVLARLRTVRGTPFDAFGYSAERKAERRLIRDYEKRVADCLKRLNGTNKDVIRAILELPQDIRGYGPVKMDAIKRVANEQATLYATLDNPADQMAAQ